jgi:ABC-type multidrug transport system fused ATPase/permease subunit
MTSWYLWLLNRWLGFYMGLIGVVATVTVAVVIVSLTSIDAALAGFALSFTLEFSSALNWVLRRYANTELVMNAAERVHEYTELVTEKETGIEVPASWPSKGQVVIRDLVAAYDNDLPPVLKGVNFEVGANQRIGVVGRAGGG